ncbi:MAG: DUF523 domain-containing protein [Firmicutes bacterium]|nr:DUF523 domain-containing protein [Bacillota bacterium]
MININGKIIVSACLVGYNCKYNGGNNYHPAIAELVKKGDVILVCPEEMGGLPTPRPACEIRGGNGNDVLDGNARVVDINGRDVTAEFTKGSQKILEQALNNEVKTAVLKERSPSCGVNLIYDGTFKGIKKSGMGVLAALLDRHGVKLYSEEDSLP